MTRFIAAALLIAGFTSYAQIKHEPGKHVVLPNPKLFNGEACEAHRRQRGAGNENRYLHGLSATPRL